MGPQETLELKISKFLRVGVIVSGIFLTIGWLSNLFLNGFTFLHLKKYQEMSLHDSLSSIINKGHWGELTGYLGLAILISLPISRVFLTAWLFIKQKEYLLAAIAGLVLMTLIVSFTLGIEL